MDLIFSNSWVLQIRMTKSLKLCLITEIKVTFVYFFTENMATREIPECGKDSSLNKSTTIELPEQDNLGVRI